MPPLYASSYNCVLVSSVKSSLNAPPKCSILRSNNTNFSGEGIKPPDQTVEDPPRTPPFGASTNAPWALDLSTYPSSAKWTIFKNTSGLFSFVFVRFLFCLCCFFVCLFFVLLFLLYCFIFCFICFVSFFVIVFIFITDRKLLYSFGAVKLVCD